MTIGFVDNPEHEERIRLEGVVGNLVGTLKAVRAHLEGYVEAVERNGVEAKATRKMLERIQEALTAAGAP